MLIHVVEQGETINSIAEKYNTSAQLIIYNNEIQNPNNLVVGQTIVILFPQVIHTVEEGDTVNSIAAEYNVSVGDIIRNNPIILNTNVIYPGQSIVISYEGEKFGTIAVNGYCYPNIDRLVLRKTLPYLSFLTVFTYGFTEEGELVEINDSEVVEIAKSYNVAPIMLISSLSQSGTFSNELSEALLNNEDAQDILIENILNNMRQKGYYGLDIDFEYVFPKDRQAYVDFISKTQKRLSEEGFVVFVALAPKTSGDQPGLLYEAHDYEAIGQVADAVFLMTYEWGYTYGPPMAVAPLNKVIEVIDYAVTVIDPRKILIGIPNYGYDWTLPFEVGTKARSISNVGAVELARETGSSILYDETAKSPYFYYTDESGSAHVVWFEDARSIEEKLLLISMYGLLGCGVWNIMKFFPQSWLVLNSMFNIYKAL